VCGVCVCVGVLVCVGVCVRLVLCVFVCMCGLVCVFVFLVVCALCVYCICGATRALLVVLLVVRVCPMSVSVGGAAVSIKTYRSLQMSDEEFEEDDEVWYPVCVYVRGGVRSVRVSCVCLVFVALYGVSWVLFVWVACVPPYGCVGSSSVYFFVLLLCDPSTQNVWSERELAPRPPGGAPPPSAPGACVYNAWWACACVLRVWCVSVCGCV